MLNGGELDNRDAMKNIKAWSGVLFHPLKVGGAWIVATVMSAVRLVELEEDETKRLVLVVPKGAQVAVTSCTLPATVHEHEDGCEDGWKQQDLRTDLMWWAHDARVPHSKLVSTIDRLKSVCWYPRMESDAAYHYRTCAVCQETIATEESIGFGVCSLLAYWVVQMDDKKLRRCFTDCEKVTYVSVLSFTCLASGETVYCLRSEMSAAEAAFQFFTNWYKRNSAPAILWSDNAPEYMSDMMAVMTKLVGVKVHWNSSRGGHCNYVERKQAVLTKVLHQAEVLGQGITDKELEVFVSHAEYEVNHVAVSDGSTVFMRTRGLQPRRSRDFVVDASDSPKLCDMTTEQVMEKLSKPEDLHMAALIHGRCCELLGEHRQQQEKRARRNVAYRLRKQYEKHAINWKTENEGIELGGLVSWKGVSYRVLDMVGPTKNGPCTALVRKADDDNADNVRVEFQELRPLAIDRMQLGMPDACRPNVEVDDLIAFWDNEGEMQLGVVLCIDDDNITVHLYESKRVKLLSFLPLWEPDDQSVSCHHIRQIEQPVGYGPVMYAVDSENVVGTVQLDGNHCLNELSQMSLNSRGVDLSVCITSHGGCVCIDDNWKTADYGGHEKLEHQWTGRTLCEHVSGEWMDFEHEKLRWHLYTPCSWASTEHWTGERHTRIYFMNMNDDNYNYENHDSMGGI